MENLKEIADKCLNKQISGYFILRRGDTIPSDKLSLTKDLKTIQNSFNRDSIISNYPYCIEIEKQHYTYMVNGRQDPDVESPVDIIKFTNEN